MRNALHSDLKVGKMEKIVTKIWMLGNGINMIHTYICKVCNKERKCTLCYNKEITCNPVCRACIKKQEKPIYCKACDKKINKISQYRYGGIMIQKGQYKEEE
jgi:hypothetical protein